MLNRILFGILWFVGVYFLACALTGGVAGAIAGARDPANAAFAGAQAGAHAVAAIRIYLFAGAVLLAVVGTWTRILPGTGRKKRDEELPAPSGTQGEPPPLNPGP